MYTIYKERQISNETDNKIQHSKISFMVGGGGRRCVTKEEFYPSFGWGGGQGGGFQTET